MEREERATRGASNREEEREVRDDRNRNWMRRALVLHLAGALVATGSPRPLCKAYCELTKVE